MYIMKAPSKASASRQDKDISSIFTALTLLGHTDIPLQQFPTATVCCVQKSITSLHSVSIAFKVSISTKIHLLNQHLGGQGWGESNGEGKENS